MTPVQVRTRVKADPARAFFAFTNEVDAWWRRGPRFRFGPAGRDGVLAFEPRVGGRFVERFDNGEELVVGDVVAWSPPDAFAFLMRPVAPGGGEGSRVEVRFVPVEGGGTEVVLTHHGLERVPLEARHAGLRGTALRNVISVWWADLLVGYAPLLIPSATPTGRGENSR